MAALGIILGLNLPFTGACFGAYFEDYLYRGRWFLTIEVGVALVSGVIGGLASVMSGLSCLTVQRIAVVPNVVYLVIVSVVRPHQRWLDLIASRLIGGLLLLSSIILPAGGSPEIATYVALTASLVSFVPALLTPVKLMQRHREERNLAVQRCNDARRAAASLAALSSDELALVLAASEAPALAVVETHPAPSNDVDALS